MESSQPQPQPQSAPTPTPSTEPKKGTKVVLIIVLVLVFLLLLGGGLGYYAYSKAKKAIKTAVTSTPTSTSSDTGSPSSTETMPTTDVAGTDIVGVVRYPGSIRTRYSTTQDNNFYQISYKVRATSTKIINYYRTNLVSAGWKLLDSDEESLSFSKNSASLTVTTSTVDENIVEYQFAYYPSYY